MQAVSIRKCVSGDEAVLSLIGQATFLETFAEVVPGKDIVDHCVRQHSVEKYARWLEDPGSALWLAEVEPGSAPVGYLVLTRPDLPVEDLSSLDGEVKRVYLLHRFQGGGAGARLMREAHATAWIKGFTRLLLSVNSRNETALSFYAKLGYRQIGRHSFEVAGRSYDNLILTLSLIQTTAGSP
jgi:GNAT superfamily N-acetyltransferase